jgi:hypothetical protein
MPEFRDLKADISGIKESLARIEKQIGISVKEES